MSHFCMSPITTPTRLLSSASRRQDFYLMKAACIREGVLFRSHWHRVTHPSVMLPNLSMNVMPARMTSGAIRSQRRQAHSKRSVGLHSPQVVHLNRLHLI